MESVDSMNVVVTDEIGEISATLRLMSEILTWTTEKKRLKGKLEELLNMGGYMFFKVDSRGALFDKYGQSGFFKIPMARRGALQSMRGNTVHLIRLESARYSSVYFAVKRVSVR